MSQFAFAPPPEERKNESEKPHMPPLSQVDRNLVAENRALYNANERLKQENKALDTRIHNTQRAVVFLVLACIALIVLLMNVFNALHGANLRLSQALDNNAEQLHQIESMQDRLMDLTATATATITTTATVKKSMLPVVTPKPTATPKPVVMVYIPYSGKRYHDSERCAGVDAECVPLSEAKSRGYTPCGNCRPPK